MKQSALVGDPETSRIAHALAWRNADAEHYFLPYRGHPSAPDLRRVCNDPRLLLERDLADLATGDALASAP